MLMKNWFRLVFLSLVFICNNIVAKSLPSDSQPEQPDIIYREVYKTAMKDGTIDEAETALLKSLQEQLALPDSSVISLARQVREQKPDLLDQSGRWPLVMQNIGWACGLYGWGIPYALQIDDNKWYVGTEMLSLSAAFYLTYKYTQNSDLSHARTQMMRTGSAIGFRYGWGINTLLDLWEEDNYYYDEYGYYHEETKEKSAWVVTLMAAVPLGHYVGDKLYYKWQPSNGQAWSLTLWSEIASFSLRQLHYSVDAEPESENWDQGKYTAWDKRQILADMAGYPLGLWLGHKFFGSRDYTFGDALMLGQGRAVGWLYSLMLSDMIINDNDLLANPLTRLMMAGGSVGGTVLMDHIIAKRDYTFGQSILSWLGTASGMAFGAGLMVLTEIDEPSVIEAVVMAGGLGGFVLSDKIFGFDEKLSHSEDTPETAVKILPQFSVMPEYNSARKLKMRPALSLDFIF